MSAEQRLTGRLIRGRSSAAAWAGGSSSDLIPQILTVLLGILGGLIFLLTDADGNRGEAEVWLQWGLESLVVVGAAYAVHRNRVWFEQHPVQMPVVLGVLILSLLWEPLQRLLLGTGRPFEMLVMHSQKNVMLALAATAMAVGFRRLSVFIGVAICIFCCAMTRDNRVIWFSAMYGVLSISWLMACYWSGLQGRMLPGQRTRLPLRWIFAAPALGLLTAAGSAGGGRELISSARGFLPGSGGDGDYSEFSRGGVNDGESLVAGENDIRSFGPLEDAPFADSEKPSLYDVVNDQFDEPVRRNRQFQPAIALPPEMMAEVKERLSRVQQAGREFSLVRRRSSAERRRAKSISSAAMFYVAGRAPLHLRTEVYDVFDGVNWHPVGSPTDGLPLHLVESGGRPWLRLPQGPRGLDLFTHTDLHVVRPVNLKSPVIPGPPGLRQLHIDRVDRPDMFMWHAPGVVRLTGDSIPELVAIHLQSDVMDPARLREGRLPMNSQGREMLEQTLPAGEELAELRRLAVEWTAETPRGMAQVDEICDHLRSEFALMRGMPIDEQSESPIRDFLRVRRGPEYLFASTAALMLRSLGYATRLVSGFYVRPERYESQRRQTPVLGEDVHFWCEVLAGPSTWATVEACPGYEVEGPPPGLWQRFSVVMWGVMSSVMRNWTLWSVMCVVLWVLFWQRAWWIDGIRTAVWRLFPASTVWGRVRQTVRLLEGRLILAGLKRPAHITLRRWLNGLPFQEQEAVRQLVALADAAAFGVGVEGDYVVAAGVGDIRVSCVELQRQLNLRRCRAAARERQTALRSGAERSSGVWIGRSAK